jgi:hypothetical protein
VLQFAISPSAPAWLSFGVDMDARIAIVALANELGRYKQMIFKVVKRVGIIPQDRRESARRNQMIKTVSAAEAKATCAPTTPHRTTATASPYFSHSRLFHRRRHRRLGPVPIIASRHSRSALRLEQHLCGLRSLARIGRIQSAPDAWMENSFIAK